MMDGNPTHPATIRKRQEGRRIGIVGDVYRFLATGADTDDSTPRSRPSGRPAAVLLHISTAAEKMFFQVATPLADDTETAPPPSESDIRKLLEAAPRYEVEVEIQMPHHA